MLEFIGGVVCGAVGAVVAQKQKGEKTSSVASEVQRLTKENEMLRLRNKEAEERIEELLVVAERNRRASKEQENNIDNMEDALDESKRKLKVIESENELLLRELQEYKELCANYKSEITQLKSCANE